MGVMADGVLETSIVTVAAKLCAGGAGSALLLADDGEEARGVYQRIARRHGIGQRYEGFFAHATVAG